MELDSATLVALIAAIAAIIAPVITSCVTGLLENRRHKLDISIEKMKLVYPEKQQAYLALASELSRLVDSNGNGYDRIKLIYAVYALRQMSRELRDTQAQIDKSHRRCK